MKKVLSARLDFGSGEFYTKNTARAMAQAVRGRVGYRHLFSLGRQSSGIFWGSGCGYAGILGGPVREEVVRRKAGEERRR